MAAPRTQPGVDTLAFHRAMLERRLEKFRQREGMTQQEAEKEANDPALFVPAKRTPVLRPSGFPASKEE